MQPVRIVIADDHAIIRHALAGMLATFPGAEICAEAEHGIEAIAAVKVHQPDLLFLDIAMPYIGGLEVFDEVHQWSPATQIAVFTGVRSGGVMRDLLDRQPLGLLLKSTPPEELRAALGSILRGEHWICAEASELARETSPLAALTARERQVMQQLVSGASNQQIAERFHISAKTVDNHRTNLMRKLDVHSAGALVQIALREGLLGSDGQST